MPDCQNFLKNGTCLRTNCSDRHIRVCTLCEVICTDNATYELHLHGKQHRFRKGGGGEHLIWCEFCRVPLKGTRYADEQHRRSPQHLATTRDFTDASANNARLCHVCDLHITTQAWSMHLGSQVHRRKVDFAPYRAAASHETIEGALSNVDFGVIEVDGLEQRPEEVKSYTVTITSASVMLQRVFFQSSRRYRKRPYMPAFYVPGGEFNRTIDRGVPFTSSVIFRPHGWRRGRYIDTMVLEFVDLQSGREFSVGRQVVAVVTNVEDFHLLQPTAPYNAREVRSRVDPTKVVSSPSGKALAAVKWKLSLPWAPIPKALQEVLDTFRTVTDEELKGMLLARDFIPQVLDGQLYKRFFKALLHIEEDRLYIDLQDFDMQNVPLRQDNTLYYLQVSGLSEGRPSVIIGDNVLVRPVSSNEEWYEGRVVDVLLEGVRLQFRDAFRAVHIGNVDVQFRLNRLPLRRIHQGLEMRFAPPRILFPEKEHIKNVLTPAQTDDQVKRLQPVNRKIEGNIPQLRAIATIVHMPMGSAPFIVFGPPGTGKTLTVVEAIRQLTLKDKAIRILACAPSNSAADLITERLMKDGMNARELFRLNAPSRSKEQIRDVLLPYSKLDAKGVFTIPAPDVLASYRVIVCTCLSASVPYGIGLQEGHFSHIFVDEVGQAMEPEALIAIRTMGGPSTNLVIAGDPKQLGPICHSHVAENIEPLDSGRHLGLGWSYLDRLMERDAYSELWRNVTWVKLLKNWRSHPSILTYPNQAFYQDELEAHADPAITRSLLRFDGLRNKEFPIIFHALSGQEEREGESPSYFNRDEASLVKKYVTDLLSDKRLKLKDSDIGIITPYSAQCRKLRQVLRKYLPANDVKVGSVEEFQGQERRVIIISGVRSKPEGVEDDARNGLGFVRNPRRFNVAITRAQALLIVIGNPDTLEQDEHWKAFMSYVHVNDGWVGLDPNWDTRRPEDASFGDAVAAAFEERSAGVPNRGQRGLRQARDGRTTQSYQRQTNGRSVEMNSAWLDAP